MTSAPDPMFDEPVGNKPVIGVAMVVLVLAACGGWYYYYWRAHNAPALAVPRAAAPPSASAVPAEEPVQHPVPTTGASPPSLPALADSDAPFNDALDPAVGAAAQYLIPESLIRHLVVTVDNLPRQKVAVDKRPLAPVAGTFLADGDELHATLDPQNFQRYEPLVSALQRVDMQKVAAVYLRFYPLFQKAYQDLGYPNGYFNDRLVKVIDELLATPQVTGPIDLVRPNVMYDFADPLLESRPAGQKLLIRMGPDNAAVVKAKLTELRALITASAPQS